jgi:gliding motility-associated-like protein
MPGGKKILKHLPLLLISLLSVVTCFAQAPLNDNPCNAIQLLPTAACNFQTFSNANATGTSGVPAPGCAGYSGGDVWFKVIVPTGGSLIFDSQTGTMLDGGMAVYKGSCASLKLISCDNDASANGAMPKITATGLTTSDTIWIRMWENGNNNNGTFGICISEPPPPPINDDPCTAIELTPSFTCTYQTFTNESATASKGPSLPGCGGYTGGDVWFRTVVPAGGILIFDTQIGTMLNGGMALYGVSCSKLTLLSCDDDGSVNGAMPMITANGLSPADTIWIRIWGNGINNNGTFGICVTKPPAPSNDEPCNAIELPTSTNCTYLSFTNKNATATQVVPNPLCAGYNGADIWFKVVVPPAGTLSIDTQTGEIIDGGMAIYRGTCKNLTLISCNDDSSPNGSMPLISSGPLTPGDTIWVRFWEYSNDLSGTFGICVTVPAPVPVNDNPCTAIELIPSANCNYKVFTNEGAFPSTGIPLPGCANYLGADVWFKTVVPGGGTLTFDSQIGTMLDGGMALYRGNCRALTLLACDNDNSVNGLMPSISAGGMSPGDTIWIRVWENGNNNNGTFGICVTIPSVGPINDNPCKAISLAASTLCNFQTFTNAGATNTVSIRPPVCANYMGADVWFQVVVPAGGELIIDTHEKIMTDAGMAVYTGITCNSINLITCEDNNGVNGTMPTIYLTGLTPGITAWIRVWANGNINNGTFDICVTVPAPQPATISFSCIKDTTIGCGTCFSLSTTIPNIHSLTNDYFVSRLSGPGNCFKPYVAPGGLGPSANLINDDVYTDVIAIPFTFPFYGKTYNGLIASTNGYLSFDTSLAKTASHWQILGAGSAFAGGTSTTGTPLNLPNTLYDGALIMGPYHDLDPFYSTSPGQRIKYNITGVSPNRRWILTFNKVPLFYTTTGCDQLINNTHQIVLYEGSGMVEIFLFDKQVCTAWNRGRAIIGLQDSSRTRAIMAPGRQASDTSWGKIGMNESWRFTPVTGPTLFKKVELYDTEGNLLATGDTSSINTANFRVRFDVCPAYQKPGTTTYIVKTIYQHFNNPTKEVTATDTMRVSRTSVFNVKYIVTSGSCSGTIPSSIKISANGVSPYQYSVDGGSNFQADSSFMNLPSGTYHIVVKDASNCARDTTVIITTAGFITAAYRTTAAKCNGANGKILVQVNNGSSPFSYSSNSGTSYQADSTFFLPAGTYSIRVKDNNNCSTGTIVAINQPPPLISSYAITPITCGVTNGKITFKGVSGGTPPYRFSSDGGATYQSDSSFTLAAGVYDVQVKDFNDCTKDSTIKLSQPVAIISSYVVNNVTCNGGSNGQIDISNISGGTPPYQFSKDGGLTYQSGNSFMAGAGIYYIRIKDINNCTKDTSIAITQPAAFALNYGISDVKCNGDNDGQINISVISGGQQPYQYSINGGTTYQFVSSFVVPPAIYNVRIKDANGCTKDSTVQILQPDVLGMSNIINFPKCYAGTDGSVIINAVGGKPPFQYSINGGNTYQTNNTFHLSKGIYNLRVKDANNCMKDTSIQIIEPPLFTATSVTANATCSDLPNGKISVTADGGGTPYSFSIDNGATFQASSIFNVEGGTYTILVKDNNGCTLRLPVSIGFIFNLTLLGRQDTSICGNIPVPLNTVSNAQTFSWLPASSLDNDAVLSPTASPNTTTDYILTARSGSCILKDTVTIKVTPGPVVFAGDDITVAKGEDALINASIINASDFTWSPTTYLSNANSLSLLSVQPQQTVTYKLTATNSGGCSTFDEVKVIVMPFCIRPANVLTPNGDGVNEVWLVYEQTQCFRNLRVRVFNRYGAKVFESNNYSNDWRGTHNGHPLPDATYYYVVDYILLNGTEDQARGNITILR